MKVHKIVQKNQASLETSYFLLFLLFLYVLNTDFKKNKPTLGGHCEDEIT